MSHLISRKVMFIYHIQKMNATNKNFSIFVQHTTSKVAGKKTVLFIFCSEKLFLTYYNGLSIIAVTSSLVNDTIIEPPKLVHDVF